MAPKAGLLGYALTFAAGFFFGFMYHHIASMAHSNLDDENSPQIRSLESRLAIVEGRLAAKDSDAADVGYRAFANTRE